jgi:hypothetical protein
MYEALFRGRQWELIHIADARSLAEGYNRGFASSRGDILIFSHDDIDIFSPDMPSRLEMHLQTYDVVGLAGTTKLIGPAWHYAGPPHIFGQVAGPHESGKIIVGVFGAPRPVMGDIQAIDGLFMAARRSVFSKVSFDPAFDGFHLYDIDFSYAAYRAGLKVAVASDICVFHASPGNYDEKWKESAKKFVLLKLAHLPRVPYRTFDSTTVMVSSLAEALEIMNPPYWRQIPANPTEPVIG